MIKKHLKRLATPKNWPIKRKGSVFITRPNPGAHTLSLGVSLNTLFKEIIPKCKTRKEVMFLLNKKGVLVDGRRRKDPKYNVGLMDVVEIPSTKEYFRILLDEKGKLFALQIDKKDAELKPVRIKGKTVLKKGKIQLNTGGGRNILVEKDDYKVGESLILKIPEQKIVDHIKPEKGAILYFIDGTYAGHSGKLEKIDGNKIIFKNEKGELFETKKGYEFLIGKDKPLIKIK
ncbi:30S ribosomal protein S4e [Candidatus Woesearchaeota archaeon]|nr:MAG: 30S ribosomal protein S4e [Candidatus Woesearchaeota archaeon]